MQKLSLWVLRCFGWKIVGQLPQDKHFLVIVAPHTSNWDFFVGILARFAVGRKIYFLAKKQLFVFPIGPILTFLGGSPVDRSKNENQVTKAVALFQQRDEYVLAITPEGTRGPVSRWKEGFYYIVQEAQVPLVPVSFDFPTKEVRIGAPFSLTGNIAADFPMILDYFRTMRGRHPKVIPDYVPRK